MRNILIAGLVALAIVAGSAGYIATTFEKPTFGIEDKGDWGEVTENSIEVNSKFWINNPNPVGLSLGFIDIKYRAEANNLTLASGKKEGIGLGEGNNTKEITTELKQSKIPNFWYRHLKNNETSSISVPVTVNTPVKSFSKVAFTKEVETDLTDKIEKNLNSIEGTYEGPGIEKSRNGFTVEVRPELEVREILVSWGEISQETTETNLDFKIHNPNSYAVPAPSFKGNATLNNVTIAKWTANGVPVTELAENGTIAPGETEKIRFKVGLRNQKMDEWLETHVKRNEYTEADIYAQMIFRFNGKDYTVPAGGLKCEFNIQTAILVDNQSSDFTDKGCDSLMGSYPDNSGESSSNTEELNNYSVNDSESLTRSDLLN